MEVYTLQIVSNSDEFSWTVQSFMTLASVGCTAKKLVWHRDPSGTG